MCGNVGKSILMIGPLLVALFPCSDMLSDEVRAQLLRFRKSDVSRETKGSARIVDRNQACADLAAAAMLVRSHTLPLLHGERLVCWHSKPHHLALRVEGIEVNVCNDT